MRRMKALCSRILILTVTFTILYACSDENNSVAPYIGSPPMSSLTIQEYSYQPNITWLGGYTSIIATNRGSVAKLDSTLIWTAYKANNEIKFPIQYGTFPNGSISVIGDYGGREQTSLSEDEVYNIWVVKETVWNLISDENDKILKVDSFLVNDDFWIDNDTVKISNYHHTQLPIPLDIYVNIDWDNTQSFGRLGEIIIEQTDTSNNINVVWNITQSGIEDSLISAIGICLGSQYDINKLIWEIWSEENIEGETVFGKKNVISDPLILGQEFAETRIFGEWPETGLERNQNYYLWIASKEWDGEGRGRATNGYAYMKLTTW